MQQPPELPMATAPRAAAIFHVSLGRQTDPHQRFEARVPPGGEEREVQVLRVAREPVQEPQRRTADERPVGECAVVLQGEQAPAGTRGRASLDRLVRQQMSRDHQGRAGQAMGDASPSERGLSRASRSLCGVRYILRDRRRARWLHASSRDPQIHQRLLGGGACAHVPELKAPARGFDLLRATRDAGGDRDELRNHPVVECRLT